MGVLSNLRGLRGSSTTTTTQETLPITDGVSSVAKKKWSNLMPLVVALVVIAEIAFLGRLDMAKNAALVDSWADLFYRSPPQEDLLDSWGVNNRISESESCEDWLEKEDAVVYSRDFEKEPVFVSGGEKV